VISVLETNGKHGDLAVKVERWRITLSTMHSTMHRALQTPWFPNVGIKYGCIFVTEHSPTGVVNVKTGR